MPAWKSVKWTQIKFPMTSAITAIFLQVIGGRISIQKYMSLAKCQNVSVVRATGD